jgi:hypothetical protein
MTERQAHDRDTLGWVTDAVAPHEPMPAARQRVATEADMVGLGFFADEVLLDEL